LINPSDLEEEKKPSGFFDLRQVFRHPAFPDYFGKESPNRAEQ